MKGKAKALDEEMQGRRSVRDFSDEPIPKEVIEHILSIANSAPSGANKQPWTFCVVSNPELKKKIREAAEKEEFENYHGRMNEEWLRELRQFGTNYQKPFLEIAPYLIVVFKRAYEVDNLGQKHQNYYVNESVGIASGFLLSAIHQCGLVSLTHTPSPMNFLHTLLNRPENERAFLLIPIAKLHPLSWVPDIRRKTQDEYAVFCE
ncbi:MAG: nitroreductase family protein [Bacteroidetes bacterium]|nr:nitroreductase family protein [Bacteroidota bacterium]